MKNIKAVRLENFQSHLDTYIEFGDGLNVIVGQSDSGKTAILRGIRWVLYNQPRGTDFIRVSGDFVRVSITFENETVIIRERTGSKNRYTIKKAGHEDLVLEGFGIHVPEEVIESHGMGLMRIDHDNELMIHLSQQLDGPFLLEQTSSIRAKTLGRISGAHFLDMAIRDTTKDLSQLNLKMKQEQAIIEQLNSDLEPFNGLSELQHKLVSSEQRIEKVKTMLKRKEKLVKLQSKWVQMKKEEELASTKKRLVKDVDNWDEGFNRVQQLVQRFLIFKQKKQRNDELKRSIQICHNWIEKTQHTGTVSSNYERLLDEVKQVQKFKEHAVYMKQLQTSIDQQLNQLKKTTFIDSVNIHEINNIMEQKSKRETLYAYQQRLQQNQIQLSKVQNFQRKLPDMNALKLKHEHIERLSLKHQKLQLIQNQIKDYQMRIVDGKHFKLKQIKEQEQAEKELQDRLLEMGTCPTCGQKICKHGEQK